MIHPTAIISDKASIAENVKIGPFCVIGDDVVLGDNCELAAHVVIDGDTHIGEGTKIYSFASIGSPPQDLKHAGEKTQLRIGKNNKIREHVTMNTGTKDGGGLTKVGDNCLFMVGAHVAHDCIIGNNVILANNATLGGHVEVNDFVIIGGMSAVHQFIRIGAYAIIGGFSGVESDVIPYGRVKGERAHLAGLNLIGLERQGFDKSEIKNLQKAYNQLFSGEQTLDNRIEAVEKEFAGDEAVAKIIAFAKTKTKFSLCQPPKRHT
ncbi:MAG: acyl-ACP--UDP-N-acetylglucosamine O-acyltransferase [Alphaproteobacteria bacterium]